MRAARAVHTALPLVALAGLGVLGPVRTPAPPAMVPARHVTANLLGAGRIITDGRPQPLPLPGRHAAAARGTRPGPAPTPARAPRPDMSVRVTAPRPVTAPTVVRRVVAAPATRDAYPYDDDATWGNDPWGFTKRQCVSYVAWRLAEAGRPLDNRRDGWSSARNWDDVARRLGYPVSSTPSVGAVAQWDAGEHSAYWSPRARTSDGTFVAGTDGHVAWVTAVHADGSVEVAQYNGTGDRSYSTMRVRAPRYLAL